MRLGMYDVQNPKHELGNSPERIMENAKYDEVANDIGLIPTKR